MFQQRSFKLNNKENNPRITNMESEEMDSSYPAASAAYVDKSNSMQIEEVSDQPTCVLGEIEGSSNIPNRYFGNSNSHMNNQYSRMPSNILSNGVDRKLFNDLRVLAAQNQKTEQSLRDLQQKIHTQKDRRQSVYSSNENKENGECGTGIGLQQRIKPRINSISTQQTFVAPAQNNDVLKNNYSYQPRVSLKTNIENTNPISKPNIPTTRPSSQIEGQVDKKVDLTKLKNIDPIQKQVNSFFKEGMEVKEENISQRLARLKINSEYSQDILNHLCEKEYQIVPKDCLARHNIPINLRAKMIDWMIEVMKSYKCSEETFFMSVRIMDMFFQKTNKTKEIGDLHLIGIACMFIAGKFEEIYPIQLQVIQERIGHKKFSSDQIKEMETEILNALGFNLLGTSPYEIAMQTLTLADYQENQSKQEFTYAQKICLYLSKMVLYDYEFNKNTNYSLLAASIIFIIFKIFQQIIPHFSAENNIKRIISILKVNSKDLVTSSTRILHLAKNFEESFPDLGNLKKFDGFEMQSFA